MGKVKRSGREVIGECPLCHKKEHLYVTESGDKLLVHCHHCNANGGDIIKEFISMGAKGELIEETKAPRKEVSRVMHDYRDTQGNLVFQKARCKYSDGSKEFRYVWNDGTSDKIIYRKPDNSINLYNLDLLAKADSNTILYIVEGEKCADAMIKNGLLATTGHCGAKKHMDLTEEDKSMLDKFPVKVIIPDNDAKGEDYINAWGKAYILRMTEFWQDCPNKGDVADYFEQGGTAEDLRKQENRFVPVADLSKEAIEKIDNVGDITSSAVMEGLWQVRDDSYTKEQLIGLLETQATKLKCLQSFRKCWRAYQQEKVKRMTKGTHYGNKSKVKMQPIELYTGDWTVDDKGITDMVLDSSGFAKPKVICPTPILPVEVLYNYDKEVQTIRIAYFVNDKWHRVAYPRSVLANQSKILCLADVGIGVDSNNAKALTRYFTDVISHNMDIIPQKSSVSHLGWTSLGFIPYTEEVSIDTGKDMETLIKSVSCKGELQEWVDFVKPLRENIMLRLIVASSFASPLILPCGCLPFVTHVHGGSGIAKTVSLMVAASVWGNPNPGDLVRSMNMTQNNLMTVAATLHSIPLFGDELQTIKEKDGSYDKLIMRYTEGVDKGRNKDGESVVVMRKWRNAFITTGEEPITSERSGGGAKNRVIEIECDKPLVESGHITANFVREHYGCAGKTFIETLPPTDVLKTKYDVWFNDAVKRADTTEKQAMAIAMICLADELSSEIIFKDTQADPELMYSFCKSKDEIDQSNRAWRYIVDWIAENSTKFNVNPSFDSNYSGQLYGRQKDEHNVLIIKSVLCKALQEQGFVFDAVKKEWGKKGRIMQYKDKYVENASINGSKAYCVHLVIE